MGFRAGWSGFHFMLSYSHVGLRRLFYMCHLFCHCLFLASAAFVVSIRLFFVIVAL